MELIRFPEDKDPFSFLSGEKDLAALSSICAAEVSTLAALSKSCMKKWSWKKKKRSGVGSGLIMYIFFYHSVVDMVFSFQTVTQP